MKVATNTIIFTVLYICLGCNNAGGFRAYFNNYYDEMANSACMGLSHSHGVAGHIAAVRRDCSHVYADCKTVCQNLAHVSVPFVAKGNYFYLLSSF